MLVTCFTDVCLSLVLFLTNLIVLEDKHDFTLWTEFIQKVTELCMCHPLVVPGRADHIIAKAEAIWCFLTSDTYLDLYQKAGFVLLDHVHQVNGRGPSVYSLYLNNGIDLTRSEEAQVAPQSR